METEDLNQPRCPWCGGTEFAEGRVQTLVGFAPNTQSFLQRIFGFGEPLRASKCKACGFVVHFGKPELEQE